MWNVLRRMRWSHNVPEERFGVRAVIVLLLQMSLIVLSSVGLATLWVIAHVWNGPIAPAEFRAVLLSASDVWTASLIVGSALYLWRWA